MRACYKHLSSTNSENQAYYKQVDSWEVERTQVKIESILKEALQNKTITKDEYDGMIATDKGPGRFYCNFKVHKPHEPNKAPPERPIISGSGSITEGIGEYVHYHIRDLGTQHDSYIQDTPDFLIMIEKINQGPKLNPNVLIATMHVSALFTNIIHTEGMSCMQEALNTRQNIKVPTEFIMQLMNIILNNNIFEFHETHWKQEIGAAMGGKPIPDYANIFMAKFDKKIRKLAEKTDIYTLAFLKRFLDDFFLLFFGYSKMFHKMFDEINKIHPSIKLTMNHTSIQNEPIEDRCDCPEIKSIPFLDTLCTIIDGKIDTDLFKKDTDRNQYLLPSSCHPIHTTKSIPYSLSLRIIRICRDPIKRDKRLEELKSALIERGYPIRLLDSAIDKARKVPRRVALRPVTRTKDLKGPIFAHTFDPRLPPISKIQAKHWRVMVSNDTHMAEVFERPPVTAYRKQPNIRNALIRAKVPQNSRPRRTQ